MKPSFQFFIFFLLSFSGPLLANEAASYFTPSQAARCPFGPVKKNIAGETWLAFGCKGGESLVFVAEKGSTAAPYTFLFLKVNGEYLFRGKGEGNAASAARAKAELGKMYQEDIDALIAQTGAR